MPGFHRPSHIYYCFKLKTALFFRLSVVRITVLNNIVLIISQSCLSIAQARSTFKHLDTHMFTYATPTLITKALSCFSSTGAFNNCYSVLKSYTALANSC